MRSAFPLLALLVALIAAPAGAQTAGTEPAAAAAGQVGAETAASVEAPRMEAAPQTSSGLPLRDTQARTMRAYWHVFIAFAATWILLFGYALSMGRRFGRLEDEVQRLRESASS